LSSAGGVQWAVNAYLVASAACIVLGGQAADRFGARLTSMVGLTLFGVMSSIIASWHFAGPRGSLRG
jgi:MFS family permease